MLDRPDTETTNIGFNFDNSYINLPESLYRRTMPEKASHPSMILFNHSLAQSLGLDPTGVTTETLELMFSGQSLPHGAEPISQAYAGHQFGNFTYLGDGRAHLIGEHLTPSGERFDVQFKGSGRTPYSRSGDGRAALGPMLREYIISEALHALGIPTTRSLAVVTTGEPVFRKEVLPGAVLTRIAASHIRVGTFQYLAAEGDLDALRKLADHVIERHYPGLEKADNPYLALLQEAMSRQIDLITSWMRIGFIHGVMNTDNMVISGETIDYGPCAFMDNYDPETVFSSIDRYNRYGFSNQSRMAQWNLARFAETLLPLLDEDEDTAFKKAEKAILSFTDAFERSWLDMMRAKLGLSDKQDKDKELINALLNWMHAVSADYTNTFADLTYEQIEQNGLYSAADFIDWHQKYQARKETDSLSREDSFVLMQKNNPAYIPRNHNVESALYTAEVNADLSELHELLDVIQNPYEMRSHYASYQRPPTEDQRVKRTFCGT